MTTMLWKHASYDLKIRCFTELRNIMTPSKYILIRLKTILLITTANGFI